MSSEFSDGVAGAELRSRVLALVASKPSPTRAAYRRRVVFIAVAGALATVAMFLGMGGLSAGTRPAEMIALTAGLALLAAAVLTRLSAGQAGSMLGRPRSVLLSAFVVTAPVLAVLVFVVTAVWPEPAREHVEGATHLACGTLSVLQGALPLLVLLWPKRGTDPVHPVVTGAALGMTAGAWTMLMATLRCPHASASHCILAHVVPTLILTALGAGLGWALLRVRSES